MIKIVKLLLITCLVFAVDTKSYAEDDITAVLFAAEQRIEVHIPKESKIELVVLFKLYNPGQYNEKLGLRDCNLDSNVCSFYFDNKNLIQGQIYQIQLFVSSQNEPIVYTFVA